MFKVAITDYTFGSLEVEQGILQSAGGKIASGQCRTPEAFGCSLISLNELLSTSDIVTLHCPSNDKTRGLISADTLAQMRPASILINVGRGDLVQLDALTKALNSGHLAAAALDVFDQEPLDNDSPLPKMDNVTVSSHVASASPKSILALRETVGNLALKAVRGEPLPNVVNGVS